MKYEWLNSCGHFCVALITRVPQACRKKEWKLAKSLSPWHMCVHTFLCIAEIFMWKRAVGLLKKLFLTGGRFYRGQAGRHSENCINVKQIKMWFFQTRPFHHILLWSEDNKHLCFAIQCLSGWIIISHCALVNAEQFQENINSGTPRSEKKHI